MSVIEVVGAVFTDRNQVLAFRRKQGKVASGKWEFPGGKVEPGEDPRAALSRELNEELGLTEIKVGELIDRSITQVGDNNIDLACYYVSTSTIPETSKDHDSIQWIPRSKLAKVDWAEPDLPTVTKLVNGPE